MRWFRKGKGTVNEMKQDNGWTIVFEGFRIRRIPGLYTDSAAVSNGTCSRIEINERGKLRIIPRISSELVVRYIDEFAAEHPLLGDEERALRYLEEHFSNVLRHLKVYEDYGGGESPEDEVYRLDQRQLGVAMSNLFCKMPIPADESELMAIFEKITNIAIKRGADYVSSSTFMASSFEDWISILGRYPDMRTLEPESRRIKDAWIKVLDSMEEATMRAIRNDFPSRVQGLSSQAVYRMMIAEEMIKRGASAQELGLAKSVLE